MTSASDEPLSFTENAEQSRQPEHSFARQLNQSLPFVPGYGMRSSTRNKLVTSMPSVPTGSFRLAEQIGRWAVFAEITLSAVARAEAHPLVALDGNVHVDQYGHDIASIGFGAAYALSYIPKSECVGIIVHKLHTNPVDTTPMALAFATCHAVLACFNETPTVVPYFDRTSRCFVFPPRGPTD